MTDQELIQALRGTETQSKRELLDEAAERIERMQWIPVAERLPEDDDLVLIVASGKPRKNIELVNAVELASFCSDGWCLETWPDWTGAIVTHWMPLLEAPEVE